MGLHFLLEVPILLLLLVCLSGELLIMSPSPLFDFYFWLYCFFPVKKLEHSHFEISSCFLCSFYCVKWYVVPFFLVSCWSLYGSPFSAAPCHHCANNSVLRVCVGGILFDSLFPQKNILLNHNRKWVNLRYDSENTWLSCLHTCPGYGVLEAPVYFSQNNIMLTSTYCPEAKT